ncbi:hypothetical protein CASFOL_030749 [Castilleja foliolosa]|uniref:G protein gamma domain-containing protein n=1 Tax=Castilleja foliolosa TaxID=1961234 RepID=A0ABD3C681_9LAMI
MSGVKGNDSVPSLPPPQPKSPPELYGRRRELAKVQVLEREIGFLEEELKSIEGLQLASRSCKEATDFVTANADPLIPTTKKTRRSCHFWKWLLEEYHVSRYHGYAAVVGRLVPRYRAGVAAANVTRVICVATHVPPGVAECRHAVAGIANAAVRNLNVA